MAKQSEGGEAPGVNREVILLAAARLFQERGYEGTSMASVATAVGVSPPALYWHFKSKSEILFEFLRTTLANFNEQIAVGIGDATDPSERLRLLAESHTSAQLGQLDVSVAYGRLSYSAGQLAQSLGTEQFDELIQMQRAHLHLLRAILQDGVATGQFEVNDVTATAFAVINMCEFVEHWYRPDGTLEIADVERIHGELALRMVSARKKRARPARRATSERGGIHSAPR